MKPRNINLVIMEIGLVIIIVLAWYFWNINQVMANSIPSDYVSGSGCPTISRECDCTNQEIGAKELVVPLVMKISGNITSYCYRGLTTNCKCFENECPVGSVAKEINCLEKGLG